jgi:hypothetical protein
MPSEEGERASTTVSPAGIASSKRAARRFLAGLLPYTYGLGQARKIRAATASLRRQLAADPPRVPPRERRRNPRVVLLQSDSVGRDRAELVALIDDGRRRYTIALALAHSAAGWQVDRAGS